MKKIVILGGGTNQIPLIKSAKELGYYVVLCDFRDNVEGIALSDVHYQVNTLNYDEVAYVCKKEHPDGIISNSEPAMPIVAKISQAFGLIGNSEESISTLMSKNKFRALQKRVGCFSPSYYEITSVDEIWSIIDNLKFPIIIKPAQCSGSRGSRRIDSLDSDFIVNTCNDCFHYTTNGKVVVEEFVEMPILTTVEGDVFIHNDKIMYDGIFSTTRAAWAPMVPMTYTAPVVIDDMRLKQLCEVLQKLFAEAKIKHGEYNIEGYFTKNGDCFIIEINVRQGGHEIPLLIKDFTGIDYTKLLVSTSVGDDSYWNEVVNKPVVFRNIIKQTTFSQYEGEYDGLMIDASIKDRVYRVLEKLEKGDKVKKCVDGQSLVAIVDLEFPSRESQLQVYEIVNDLIKVITI
jgi:biotin carboxylase